MDSLPRLNRHSVRRWMADKAALLMVLVAGATLAAYLGRFQYLLELATHFRALYLIAAAILTTFLLVLKSWRWAVLGLVVVGLNFVVILPYYLPREFPTAAPNLRVLEANVLTTNRQYDRFLSLVRSQRPDVIALLEVNSAWMQALSALEKDYPYKVSQPRGDNFGIAVFSRFPFTSERIFELPEAVPAISIQITVAGRPVTFLTLHTLPPGTAQLALVRNAQLRDVADIVRSDKDLAVVCGDFNSTPWSPIFKNTVARSGLKEARLGFGLQGTWPAQYSPCLIPLDHCLVSQDIGVRSFRALPSIGSDHLPLLIDLAVPPKPHV